MKKINLLVALALLSFLSSFTAKAQSGNMEWLGVWCTIEIDPANDPAQGRIGEYTFPCPPQGINTSASCVGPGMPYITVNGDAVLHINLKILELETSIMAEEQNITSGYVETFVDFQVNNSNYGIKGYYSIRLLVKQNN